MVSGDVEESQPSHTCHGFVQKWKGQNIPKARIFEAVTKYNHCELRYMKKLVYQGLEPEFSLFER